MFWTIGKGALICYDTLLVFELAAAFPELMAAVILVAIFYAAGIVFS